MLTLFRSIYILLSILKHILSGFDLESQQGGLMVIRFSVCLFKIHHHFSGCSQHTCKRLPSCGMSLEKWFRRFICKIFKSNTSTRGCALWVLICMFAGATGWCTAAAQNMFRAGSDFCGFNLSKVRGALKVAKTFYLDLLTHNRLKTSL